MISFVLVAIYCLATILNLYASYKVDKSNKQLQESIDTVADLIDAISKRADSIQKLTEALDRKHTAQSNFLWKAVIEVAKEVGARK